MSYCRVSTEQDDQLNSLENQKRYFEEATSGNSCFTLQTDKNKINITAAPYKLPYFTVLHIIPLIVKRFSEAACGLCELASAVFAFVALSVGVKACFYTVRACALETFHNYHRYKELNCSIILFKILPFFEQYFKCNLSECCFSADKDRFSSIIKQQRDDRQQSALFSNTLFRNIFTVRTNPK
jgi:hypothetical protein